MDFKKMASNMGSSINRAVQMTGEKLGVSEKTEYDPHYLDLCQKADNSQIWIEKILKSIEMVLQPNPALRMEEFLVDKLTTTKEDAQSPAEELGDTMLTVGNEMGPGTTCGKALINYGETSGQLGVAQRTFVSNTKRLFIAPLRRLVNVDMKKLEEERKTLEKDRLDLDAAKNKLKRKKAEAMKASSCNQVTADCNVAEAELMEAQSKFDKQMQVTMELLEKVGDSQTPLLQSLKELVAEQKNYFVESQKHVEVLLSQL